MSKPNGSAGRFTMLPLELLESKLWSSLDIFERRIIDALSIEYERQWGRANGLLRVPYRRLAVRGVLPRRVGPAMEHLESVGLVEIYRSSAGLPTTYRLMWLRDPDGKMPPQHWQKKQQKEGAATHAGSGSTAPSKGTAAHAGSGAPEWLRKSATHGGSGGTTHGGSGSAETLILLRPLKSLPFKLMSLIESKGSSYKEGASTRRRRARRRWP